MHHLSFKKSTATNEISSHNIVLKVNTPQLQRSHHNRNVSQRLPFPCGTALKVNTPKLQRSCSINVSEQAPFPLYQAPASKDDEFLLDSLL
ncbi:hypothetical protein QL285_013793 [Trifolium repens]|nr:hypothetical protein QL285_013793 [Trifolium repens]